VIEPSSSQSIVQAAGRVNRHRLAPVFEPNVAILQYNFREVDPNKNDGRKCFTRPGNETNLGSRGGSTHKTHDLCELLDEVKLGERLDSNLRFDSISHKFSRYDNDAIQNQLAELAQPIIENEAKCMSQEIYREAVLRDSDEMVVWHFDENGDWFEHEYQLNKGVHPVKRNNRWYALQKFQGIFTLPIDELEGLRQDIGLERKEAFRVSVYKSQSDSTMYRMTTFGCSVEK